ncbi:helix-turn-helix transcriptional regulator [Runella sp. MFBS21]|uniref:helix-turn-helix domain-containing protein n=1 Tax=Runella sp. MFBS21 TaxID=3034018 RepID=UPI0023F9AF5D|nr:helix-turn-helix transcriptional regulator [Runella sp. MFBS21]MDF7818133.1 helix-turn-helix transcriptional regulator [Runella sp. MFBS21]
MNIHPIGLTLREIANEKKIRIKDIASAKGISKQAVSNVWKRDSIRLSELEVWAKILGVTPEEIIDRSRKIGTLNNVQKESVQSTKEDVQISRGTFNDDLYGLINQIQVKHSKELSEKDKEIQYLREQLRVANENLGKH